MGFEIPDLNVTRLPSVDVASASNNELPVNPFGLDVEELESGSLS